MSTIARWLDPNLVESLNQLALGSRRVSQGVTAGQHRSPIKGSSLEFRQHRAYSPGDEPRRIDWRVLARSDRVFVKEYEGETNLRANIVVDASGSMGYARGRTKFDYAGRVTAALAYLMLAQREHAGVVVASGDSAQVIPPASTANQLLRVVQALDHSVPHGRTSLVPSLGRLADRSGRRSLIIILSDFFLPVTELHAPLGRLRFSGHELVLLRLLHPDELQLPFDRYVTFRGMEGEQRRTIDLAGARNTYLERFRAHEVALTAMAGRLSTSLLTHTIDQPLIETIRAIVHRRSA